MNKRAIELQFNWIFVLIAGAVIIAFFFTVVQKQRSLSEQRLSITLASQMDAIYTGAIESKGTIQPLVTPQPGIAFACNDVCECNYYIGKKATSFGDKLLFAPNLIKDKDGIAWAVEWKLPFRIANFLMLTSPNILYYFVYDDSSQISKQAYQKIIKALPKEIMQETRSSLAAAYNIIPKGYLHTRFVFIGTEQPNMRSLNLKFADEDVSGIWIGSDLQNIVFYEKSDPSELEFNEYPSVLAGDPTPYAAVFSADHQMYNCVMQNAFKKMKLVSLVSAERAKIIQTDLARAECTYATQNLEAIANAAGQLSKNFPSQGQALSTMMSVQGELQRQNANLLQQSCPELY